MKLRSSTKIAIGFTLIAAGSIYGYQFAMKKAIMGEHFEPIVPDSVDLVGINAGTGFRIIVVNEMAQLVESSTAFHGSESEDSGATEGAIKKHIPIKEMLNVLKGDPHALGSFIMKVNDRDENDSWPPVRVVWTAERLQKALNGDKVEEAALVRDLNMNLDGTPLPTLRRASLENGIVIDYPVAVNVDIRGKVTKVVGRVQEPYKPMLVQTVEKKYEDKQVTEDTIRGYYAEEANKALTGKKGHEDIRKAIETRMSAENAKELARYPEHILDSAIVVVNGSLIQSASYRPVENSSGKTYDLTIELTDEGRRRLWQYSEDRVGTQIMLIKDGVAFAAPVINHELAQGELTITQMRDERSVKDIVDTINSHKK
ncbi:MAG: hypothetical protein P4L46_05690 [Fimbriimonas sp.]|nr:hypothetical protein [Fimbriimonas sp.]